MVLNSILSLESSSLESFSLSKSSSVNLMVVTDFSRAFIFLRISSAVMRRLGGGAMMV